jgi:hypothetical protein
MRHLDGGVGGRGEQVRAVGSVEGDRGDLLVVACDLRQHAAAVLLGQEDVLVGAAGEDHRPLRLSALCLLRRRCCGLATLAVSLRGGCRCHFSDREAALHGHAGHGRLRVGLVRAVARLHGQPLDGVFGRGCTARAAFASLSRGRQLSARGHQLVHHPVVQLAHALLLRAHIAVLCIVHHHFSGALLCVLFAVAVANLHLDAGQLLPRLVALLHQSRNHATGSIMLVERLR